MAEKDQMHLKLWHLLHLPGPACAPRVHHWRSIRCVGSRRRNQLLLLRLIRALAHVGEACFRLSQARFGQETIEMARVHIIVVGSV